MTHGKDKQCIAERIKEKPGRHHVGQQFASRLPCLTAKHHDQEHLRHRRRARDDERPEDGLGGGLFATHQIHTESKTGTDGEAKSLGSAKVSRGQGD